MAKRCTSKASAPRVAASGVTCLSTGVDATAEHAVELTAITTALQDTRLLRRLRQTRYNSGNCPYSENDEFPGGRLIGASGVTIATISPSVWPAPAVCRLSTFSLLRAILFGAKSSLDVHSLTLSWRH
jgi:hypothetical protein